MSRLAKHTPTPVSLQTLYCRLDAAIALLDQMACEGSQGRKCDWRFLSSRMSALEDRIAAIADDMQLALYEQKGFYLPTTTKGAA